MNVLLSNIPALIMAVLAYLSFKNHMVGAGIAFLFLAGVLCHAVMKK